MRLFNLLKNILTLGNRYYWANGSKALAATIQNYNLCTLSIPKPGVYLVLSNIDMSIGVANNIMSNSIMGTNYTGTRRYTTRTTASAGGGLVNFRLMIFSSPGTITLQTYNYVGKAYDADYSLVAIRLLAGGGYFIGSLWRWAYETIYNTLVARRSYKNRLAAHTDRSLPHPVGERGSYNNTICKRRVLVRKYHADISCGFFGGSTDMVTGQFGWQLHKHKFSNKPNNFKRVYKALGYQNTRDKCTHLLACHRSGIDWGCVA